MDPSSDLYKSLEVVASVFGWTYFIAWGLTFYPQLFLNWKLKSVKGLSIDFIWYNFYGFLSEYRERNGGKNNLVRFNDLLFSCHSLIASTVLLFQLFLYKNSDTPRPSVSTFVVITIATFVTFLMFIAVKLAFIEWIDVLYYLSYLKLLFTCIKYSPQVYFNYSRKSTHGWSIYTNILDFTGGVFSTLQILLDAYIDDNWAGVLGDFVKFIVDKDGGDGKVGDGNDKV
ncbi:11085_t:CDS:2 [Entrophospora sp. SA101]|nr:11085_t:CDS:2 [Entrophospora sp. SA101]